ncbi:putative Xaa-Pro aminopeptidase 3-like protein, partial [Leptotrombidium deliense]
MNCVRLFRRAFCSSIPVRTVRQNEWIATSHEVERCLFSRFITNAEYKERQQKLVALIDSKTEFKNKSSLMLIPSAQRSFQADTKIPQIYYKQNADFTYLTGLNNVDSVNCVLAILGGNGEPAESILFTPMVDDYQIIWEGPGLNNVNDLTICDDVRDVKDLDDFLQANIKRQIFVSKYGLHPPTKSGTAATVENGRIWHAGQYLNGSSV